MKKIKKLMKILIIIIVIIFLVILFINSYMLIKYKDKIYDINEIKDKYTYGIVLGCGIDENGNPKKMLKDRLDKGIELYNKNIIKKIIITGDEHDGYSEIKAMYNYLVNNEIKDEDIIKDGLGYSTGESINNYKNNFSKDNGIIITQQFHLYRSLYIIDKLDLNIVGVSAKKVRYKGYFLWEAREILARCKDYIKYINQ